MEPKPVFDRQREASIRRGFLEGYLAKTLQNGSGSMLRPEALEVANPKVPSRMKQVSYFRDSLDRFTPENLPLSQKLRSIQQIIADKANSTNRTQDILKSYIRWYKAAQEELMKRAHTNLGQNTTTPLPPELRAVIEKMSEIFGQTGMIGQLYDIDLFYRKPNPFEPVARLFVSGVDRISFALVEDGDQEAEERILLHLPVRHGGEIKTGCLVEGDPELLFWHEGDKCTDLKPISQNVPDRYIY